MPVLSERLRLPIKVNVTNWKIQLLCLFLATDIGFILLHLIEGHTPLISNINFSLQKERGYSDIFQYIKEYWSALLLLFLAIKSRSILYLMWSLLFWYLFLDDTIQIHERLGLFISIKLSFTNMFYLRAVDFGELIVSALAGLIFLTAIGITYRFGNRLDKEVSKYLIKLLFALGFFGIILDMFHIMIQGFKIYYLKALIAVAEDGGELVIMSLIVCLLFSVTLQSKKLIKE